MIELVLLLGGNKGDMPQNLSLAREYIQQKIGKITLQSKEYSSEAWGFDSDDFLNQVVVCNTPLSAKDVLKTIWTIEKAFGRERGNEQEELQKYNNRKAGLSTYSARQMDIDILFYGTQNINTELLSIPHPLISQREFVLRPLSEILPQKTINNKTIAELLADFR